MPAYIRFSKFSSSFHT